MKSLSDVSAKLSAHHIELPQVKTHWRRLFDPETVQPKFKVIDACRIENGGVLPAGLLADDKVDPYFVALVPAAGAASRYKKPFAPLLLALEEEDPAAATQAYQALVAENGFDLPIPQNMIEALQQGVETPSARRGVLDALREFMDSPKALSPCVNEGASFLELKIREHDALEGLRGQVFVAPFLGCARFQEHIHYVGTQLPTLVLEQGEALSTPRFQLDGTLALDPEGKPSLVPAGHGALTGLFPSIREEFPEARSMFIRNIDNVMGTKPEALSATKAFLSSYGALLRSIDQVRGELARGEIQEARQAAAELLDRLPPEIGKHPNVDAKVETKTRCPLRQIAVHVFHVPDSHLEDSQEGWKRIFDRPVNLLGQVPNSGKDVGGTPVWAESSAGMIKVCLEMAHASASDIDNFFKNPERATHFNPVFVAAEIPADPDYYHRDHPFWLAAKKDYLGSEVIYYESLLYEILGNSLLCNTVFMEIPRLLFNPHKAIQDAAGRSIKDWIR